MADVNLLTLQNGDAWGFALAVELKRQVKKSQEEVMREMTKDLVGTVIALTPPSAGKHASGMTAKKRGERTTEGQIRRVFEGVTKSNLSNNNPLASGGHTRNQSTNWMAATHKRARRNGTVKRGSVRYRHKVMKGPLNRYIRMRKSKVGMLAAGWGKAAADFGVRGRNYPAWIKRHQGKAKGTASFKVTKDNIHVRFTNNVRYAGNVAVMRGRLNWALGRQAEASLRKRMSKGLRDAAKKSKVVRWM